MTQIGNNQDRYRRTIDYMRISITARCNLHCAYCAPEKGAGSGARKQLSGEEIVFIARQAVNLGIVRFKITGGEPLLRADCADIISALRKTDGVEQITLTTNGLLLKEQFTELKEAGLDAVNISLDTLDKNQYQRITGRDALETVLDAIREVSGRIRVKLNCVVMKGVNEDAPEQLVRFARDLPIDVRFIELMPLGPGRNRTPVPNCEILEMLERIYGTSLEDTSVHGNGPAVYRKFDGFAGSVGFISPVSAEFCHACSRLRLSAAGDLKPCLCYGTSFPLEPILHDDLPEKELRVRNRIREAIQAKPEGHCFAFREGITETRGMNEIGG